MGRDLVATWNQLGLIVLRTVTVYFFILFGLRLSGKREVGQLEPFDFVVILLIANAVQNAMVGPDNSLVGGLVAAGVLLVLDRFLALLTLRSRRLRNFLRGRARILVRHGRVYEENLKAEGITSEELMQALRENGVCTLPECRLAVLEVDGKISAIPEGDDSSHVPRRRGRGQVLG